MRRRLPAIVSILFTLVAGAACTGDSAASSAGAGPSSENRKESLRRALAVVATRTNAYYGFNTPEIQLRLPLEDAARYAEIEMHPPRLLDAGGGEVAYELERGLHDAETQIAEIRFLTPDRKSPADFSRAVGEIDLSYPETLETRVLAPGEANPGIRVAADSVSVLEELLPEAPPFSEVEPLRVYDEGGNLLESSGRSTSSDAGETWSTSEFDLPVAKVEADLVSRRFRVHVAYDVPIADPLPEERRGVPVDDPRAVAPDPESRVTIEIRDDEGAGSGAGD